MNNVDDHILAELRAKFEGRPRRQPGRISIVGWDIEYVDGLALVSSLDVLIQKRWNDFISPHDHPTILDCGANIGLSVLRYKRLYPNAEIIAFEPDPEILPVLKRNLTRNAADDVQVVQAAVWTAGGSAEWHCEGIDGSRIVGPEHHGLPTRNVRTVDLRDYLGRSIDLIKMDIEGAELEVIPGIEGRLATVQQLVVECHVMCDQAVQLAKVIDVLAQSGFRLTVNCLGPRFDLVNKPAGNARTSGYDQYVLLAAWRE